MTALQLAYLDDGAFCNAPQFNKRFERYRGANGRWYDAMIYSRTLGDGHSYNVLVIEGMQFARIDGGPLSHMIYDWKPVHYAIVARFNLDRT